MIVFEDLTVGQHIALGPTGVTREQVMAFAMEYDPQAFHLSDEAAAQTYFGRLSASGWHTAAMMLALISDNPEWPLDCRCCHEIRDLRWRAPVYPDDSLWLRVIVAGRDDEAGLVTLDVEMTNQDAVIVASMTIVLVVGRHGRI